MRKIGNLGLGWNRQWGSGHNLTTALHGSVQKRKYCGADFSISSAARKSISRACRCRIKNWHGAGLSRV